MYFFPHKEDFSFVIVFETFQNSFKYACVQVCTLAETARPEKGENVSGKNESKLVMMNCPCALVSKTIADSQ